MSVTWGNILADIQLDSEVEAEDFAPTGLLLNYGNKAIDTVEQILIDLGIHEDYFLTKTSLSVTADEKEYDFPSDIYGDKIRRLVFDDGSKKYRVHPFTNIIDIHDVQSTDDYRYWINNKSAGKKLVIEPAVRATSSTDFTLYYIRHMNQFVDTSTVLEITEASNYVKRYIKTALYEKEPHPNWQASKLELLEEKKSLIESLARRTMDKSTQIQPDLYHYYDQDTGWDMWEYE